MAEVALRLFGHDPMVVGFRQRLETRVPLPETIWRFKSSKREVVLPYINVNLLDSAEVCSKRFSSSGAGAGGGGADAGAPPPSPSKSASTPASPGRLAKAAEDVVQDPTKLPVVHVAVVACKDAAEYKEGAKQALLQWSSTVDTIPGHRWIIVHVTNKPSAKNKLQFPLFDRVFDKIRSDLGGKTPNDKSEVCSKRFSSSGAGAGGGGAGVGAPPPSPSKSASTPASPGRLAKAA
eukprot:gene24788-9637_t